MEYAACPPLLSEEDGTGRSVSVASIAGLHEVPQVPFGAFEARAVAGKGHRTWDHRDCLVEARRSQLDISVRVESKDDVSRSNGTGPQYQVSRCYADPHDGTCWAIRVSIRRREM